MWRFLMDACSIETGSGGIWLVVSEIHSREYRIREAREERTRGEDRLVG